MSLLKRKKKVSFNKLKIYYAQLLYIFFILNKKHYFSFFLINTINIDDLKIILEKIFVDTKNKYDLKICKLKLKIYMYLLNYKFFTIYNLENYNIIFNFNYILQVSEEFEYEKFYISQFKNLNISLINCFYFKLSTFFKIVSLEYYIKFIDKFNKYENFLKFIKLFIVYIIYIIKILFISINKRSCLTFT